MANETKGIWKEELGALVRKIKDAAPTLNHNTCLELAARKAGYRGYRHFIAVKRGETTKEER